MTEPGEPPAGLVSVRFVGFPLEEYQRASEHSDELLREFALMREDSAENVPTRLLALIEELRARFASFTEGPTMAIQAALLRGDPTIELRYDVPPEAADGALRLAALLDEADEFCRSGDLLTLATVPGDLAFRRWYLEEFVRQVAGQAPCPWSVFLEANPPL